VLIRAATFDLLRCVAFAGIVASATVMLRRFLRASPIRRAALPEARIGERRFASFIARMAPIAVMLVSLAGLAASARMCYRTLLVTDRGGAVHIERDVSIGEVSPEHDLDGDVWVVNRSARPLRCIHQSFGSWAYSPNWFVIPAGEARTVPRIPQNIGPDDEPREWEGDSLWLTWER
jgi:hypothetical protein